MLEREGIEDGRYLAEFKAILENADKVPSNRTRKGRGSYWMSMDVNRREPHEAFP